MPLKFLNGTQCHAVEPSVDHKTYVKLPLVFSFSVFCTNLRRNINMRFCSIQNIDLATFFRLSENLEKKSTKKCVDGQLSCFSLSSHTRTVVWECFKGDEASQWKRPKFDPSPHQNPLTGLHKNWQASLRHGRHSTCKILCRSVQGFLFPKYAILPSLWGDYSFLFVFWVLQ